LADPRLERWRKTKGRLRPLEAARAVRALVENPEDTAQVFRIVEALSGRHAERFLRKMRRSDRGRDLLARRPVVLDALTDREALRRLPEGSLGRAYLEFVEKEGISAEGLVAESVKGRRFEDSEMPPDMAFLRAHMRDIHDLWHVVCGYQGDLVGEAALLAFTFAQTKNPGIGLIIAIAWLRGRDIGVRRLIADGIRRGLSARWFPAEDWTSMLALPLDEVRRRLRVAPPTPYRPVRTRDLQAAA
jgi:ubiquinone biosynthesis protein COQ4